MKKLFIVLAILTGCQHVDNDSIDPDVPGDSVAQVEPSDRGVFSYWESTMDSDTLDMRDWDFGTGYEFTYYHPDTADECVCTFKIWGREDVGNFIMNQCFASPADQVTMD